MLTSYCILQQAGDAHEQDRNSQQGVLSGPDHADHGEDNGDDDQDIVG